MKVHELLDTLDHEVWLRLRPPAGDDVVVWSADWHGRSGYPPELLTIASRRVDGLRIEFHEDPERGDDAPMLVADLMEEGQ